MNDKTKKKTLKLRFFFALYIRNMYVNQSGLEIKKNSTRDPAT